MTNKIELRFHDVKLEGTETEGKMKVSGYANKFNAWSKELGREKRFVERIAKGAFENSINDGHDISLLAEHDNNKLLASTKNESLRIREDEQGLFFEAEISNTTFGKDHYTQVSEGLLTHMSFGFRAINDQWEKRADGIYERTIKEAFLSEISIVKNPAYEDSEVSTNLHKRSIDVEQEPTIKNLSEETKMTKEKQLKEMRAQMEALEAEVRTEEKTAEVRTEIKDEKNELRGVEDFLKGEMHTEEVRALTTGSQSITVPTVLSNTIVEKLTEEAAIFGRARSFQTTAGTLEVLREKEIGDASFVGENESLSYDNFGMDKIILEQRRAGTAIELTEQLINDSDMNIVDYATRIMTKRLARKLDEQALIGDKTNKSFEGILTSVDAERVGSHVAGGVTEDLLLDLSLAMHPDYLDGAVYVVNRPTFNQIAKIKDTDGRYLLVKDVVNDKPAYKIFGHQVIIQDKMPTAGVAGDVTVALVDFNNAAATMTKKTASFKRVTDTASALKGTQVLVLDIYADFKILNEEAIKFLTLA